MNQRAIHGKITWGELLAAAQAAGIDQSDPIDSIDIAWGDAIALRCIRDEDFGWQISLCTECEDERYRETD